jgi:hypothetical protein
MRKDRNVLERTNVIQRFVNSPATQPLVRAIKQVTPVMTVEEMAGLYEHVRVQAWIELRRRAIAKGDSFPEFHDFEL